MFNFWQRYMLEGDRSARCEYFGSAVLTKIKCLGFILSTMIVGFQLANHHRDDRISRHFFFNLYSYSTLLKELLTVNTTTHHKLLRD